MIAEPNGVEIAQGSSVLADEKQTTEFPPRAERATGDHLGRTDKDFAIEFGGYLADAVDQIRRMMASEPPDNDVLSDCWRALESAAYEFRKRAERCQTNCGWWCCGNGELRRSDTTVKLDTGGGELHQSRAELIDSILREVRELPDRTSPDYATDMLLVKEFELRLILEDLLP